MDFSQIFLIILFFATIIAIIKEPVIKFRKEKLKIDYGIAPLIAILILFAFRYVDFNVIIGALTGQGKLIPWTIIVIFFTTAYICISIDITGFFEYISFRILQFSKGDGHKLFFNLIIFAAILTVFTSNDIVTLTMTPIICYLGRHSKINPIPYLIAVFFASNTWSMVFYIGSPTNIMVAQALNLGFFEYTKLMILPTIIAGITTALLVFFLFRKQIPKKIKISKIDPSIYFRNKPVAFIGVIVLGLFFLSLLLSEFIGLEIWQITTIFAIFYLFLNFIMSYYHWSINYVSHPFHHHKTKAIMHAHNIQFKVHELFLSVHRMPWKILPLIACFFIITHVFWMHGIADMVANILNNFHGFYGPVYTSFVSAISANIMIDQPMTMLFANAMQNPNYLIEGVDKLSNGLALVIGANLGDNITLFGALAGIMWAKILGFHGVKMDYRKFLSYSIKIMPLIILITSLTLALQMWLIY